MSDNDHQGRTFLQGYSFTDDQKQVYDGLDEFDDFDGEIEEVKERLEYLNCIFKLKEQFQLENIPRDVGRQKLVLGGMWVRLEEKKCLKLFTKAHFIKMGWNEDVVKKLAWEFSNSTPRQEMLGEYKKHKDRKREREGSVEELPEEGDKKKRKAVGKKFLKICGSISTKIAWDRAFGKQVKNCISIDLQKYNCFSDQIGTGEDNTLNKRFSVDYPTLKAFDEEFYQKYLNDFVHEIQVPAGVTLRGNGFVLWPHCANAILYFKEKLKGVYKYYDTKQRSVSIVENGVKKRKVVDVRGEKLRDFRGCFMELVAPAQENEEEEGEDDEERDETL